MAFNLIPKIGQWYKHYLADSIFEIVAYDEDEGLIEIQYFAGEIEEIDVDEWRESDLDEIPEPEDWSGPYELSKEDVYYSDNPLHPENWSGPLAGIEPEQEDWY